MHLPAKSYRIESEMARLALQKTNSAGSMTESAGKPPGKKVVGILGRVRE
ncbi:pectin protein [Rutstroemia sp. NJR-2017a BBW]|nr:pectin protein [Rutstroemia sp. NJR-2017a BBW]